MRYVTEEEVEQYGSMRDTISIMKEAFVDYAEGNSSFSRRITLGFGRGSYVTMPGVFSKYHIAGLKTYVKNKKGIRHVMVFDTESSELIAIMESSRMGQLKTGALPAMVTDMLLEERDQSMCLIGTGLQAEAQLEGILSVFDVEKVSVYSKTPEHTKMFAARASKKFGVDVVPYDSPSSALKGASIVNTITNSDKPIFHSADMRDTFHINLCGANIPSRREVGEDVLAGCDLVVVEHMEQAMIESSEIIALRKNNPEVECVELRDLITDKKNRVLGKTAFKSMGVGLEDVAAAYSVLRNMDLL